jgi:colanic acid/amylovoran biosynthesis glycosyltransferase
MKTRIGYLVPEFPGQTHTWIWRDRKALAELGIDAELVSTRRPRFIVHAWAEEAQKATRYLVPLSASDALSSLKTLAQAGPVALARCVLTVFEVRDIGFTGRLRLAAMIFVAGKLAALAKERGWSQLHVQSSGDAAHIAAFTSYLARINYSISLLASLSGYGPNQRIKWQDASFGLVMSERLRSELEDKLGDAAPEQIAIAPMGVDLDQTKRSRPYSAWRPGQPARLYTCGRLNPVKGHTFLFKALAQLRAQGIELRLEVAGEEEGLSGYRDKLRRELAELGLTESVVLLGGVPEERHREALEQAHVFVLPSLDEGISVAAMEAMAMQTPVVVTDVGGMRELVDPGRDALMVPAKDPAALAQAIARILKDPALAARLSESSRQKVAQRFHHRRSAQALAECLGHGASRPAFNGVTEKGLVEA